MGYQKYPFYGDGINDLVYEDELCIIGIDVCDFRDPGWWIGVNCIFDKKNDIAIKKKLSEKQLKVLCQRVVKENNHIVFHEKVGIVEKDDLESPETEGLSILEIE